MIRIIKSYEECRGFVSGLWNDPDFSDPMLSDEDQIRNNLITPIEQGGGFCVFSIIRGEQMVGLFSFLILQAERYIEMLVGLSKEQEAYLEMFRYLQECYPGFKACFVFNPGNYILKELLEFRGAEFEPEQQKMVLQAPPVCLDTTGIELLSEEYIEQYCSIHQKDMYWIGEKVAQAQDRFRTLLAVYEGRVIGYLDVTRIFEMNEPTDLFVSEEYRTMGFERKLLAAAVELNRPNGMMVLVDVNDRQTSALYEAVGFVKVQGRNSLTAHWAVPGSRILQ